LVSAKLTREENQKHKKERRITETRTAGEKNSKPKGDLDSLTRQQHADPRTKHQNKFYDDRGRQTCDN
jgi:hypothetical protein